MPWGTSKEEQLIDAVERRDIDRVTKLIDKGANINYRREDGQVTALDTAVQLRDVELCELLLENGADVNSKTRNGYAALLIASVSFLDNFEVIDTLIKHGADVNSKSSIEHWTPLLYASGQTPPHESTIKRLIEAGARINDSNIFGATPLMYVAQFGSDELVEYFLKKGANPNLRTKGGFFVIHLAVWSTGEKILEQYKRNIDMHAHIYGLQVSFHEGMNLIVDSFSQENRLIRPRVVKLLLEYGADMESRDPVGATPLIGAAAAGNAEIVEALVQQGAKCEASQYDGETALMTAVWRGHRDIIHFLVKMGADVNSRKTTGENALEWAISQSYDDIAKLLIEAGAKLEPSAGFLELVSTRDDILSTLNRLGLTL